MFIKTDFTYDAVRRVTDLRHFYDSTTIHDYDFSWDAVNQLTQEISSVDGTVNFSYDETGQLTAVTGARSESYSFDLTGNRTMTGYTTGTGNRMTSDGSFNYSYDDEGNMLTKTEIASGEVTEYTWDHRNRLTNVTVKDSLGNVTKEVDYTYDIYNKRIGVSVDADGAGSGVAVDRWTAYNGDNPYADFDDTGSLTTRYLYGPAIDMLLGRLTDADEIAWYLTDHLGSVRDIVNTQGTVLDHIEYDSFGNVVAESNPSNGDRFKYTSREFDAETGLYYYRARYYDPNTGRFISQDPIGFEAGDANIYRYVGNAVTISTDQTGLWEWSQSRANPGNWSRWLLTGDASAPDDVFDAGLVGMGEYLFSHPPAITGSFGGSVGHFLHVGFSGGFELVWNWSTFDFDVFFYVGPTVSITLPPSYYTWSAGLGVALIHGYDPGDPSGSYGGGFGTVGATGIGPNGFGVSADGAYSVDENGNGVSGGSGAIGVQVVGGTPGVSIGYGEPEYTYGGGLFDTLAGLGAAAVDTVGGLLPAGGGGVSPRAPGNPPLGRDTPGRPRH